MSARSHRPWVLVGLAILMAGCASRREQLHRTAKDWCETIRASQVIPVYPLTADLVPGDLFLVQETVSEQHKAFEADGFLPLPFKIGRLRASGWGEQYDHVNSTLAAPGMPGSIAANRDTEKFARSMQAAPIAVFPTYSFAVQKGGSFDLAIPVSGVPIGLSALGGDAAGGSISIRNARTYGLDAVSLAQDVRAWADVPEVNQFLRTVLDATRSGRDKKVAYVRVVSRVYVAQEFDISMTSRASRSLGASVGIPSPTELLSAPAGGDPQAATVEDYAAGLQALNNSISTNIDAVSGGPAIGGDARFVAASARSVSLKETLGEPVVVGYIGFDMAVLDEGRLGPPIPTFTVLDSKAQPPRVAWADAFTTCETRAVTWRRVVDRLDERRTIYELAAAQLGGEAQAAFAAALAADEPVSEAWVAATRTILPPTLDDDVERERRWCRIARALEAAAAAGLGDD